MTIQILSFLGEILWPLLSKSIIKDCLKISIPTTTSQVRLQFIRYWDNKNDNKNDKIDYYHCECDDGTTGGCLFTFFFLLASISNKITKTVALNIQIHFL